MIGIVRREVLKHLSSLLNDYVPLVCKILRRKKWADDLQVCPIDPEDQSALNAFLRQKAKELLSDDTALVEKADQFVNAWIGKHMTQVQEGLNSLCDKYQIKKADMSLVEIHNSIKIDRIRIPSIVRFLYVQRNANWFRKILLKIGSGGIVNHALNSSITKQLKDPHGDFALSLGHEIKMQLLAQIDEQIQKVEFNI